MDKTRMSVTIAAFVVAVVMFQCALAQTVYVVGDTLGWAIPQTGVVAYSNWASDKQFMVGDILVFNFATNTHDVQQVQRDSFDVCTSTNSIGNLIMTGPTNITLTPSRENYYICTFGSHCDVGQKLAINVSGTHAASPPSTTTTPPSAPTPISPEVACPPPESIGSPSDSPTVSNTPGVIDSPPDSSSSPSLFASFFVLFLSISLATSL